MGWVSPITRASSTQDVRGRNGHVRMRVQADERRITLADVIGKMGL